NVSVLPDPTVRLSRLVTVPVISSAPPMAVSVFEVPLPPLLTFADTVPNPVSVPELLELPRTIPDASFKVPPDIWILPSEIVSAAWMVRLPPLPISNVWLALLIVIALAAVAVPVNFRSEADAEAMVKLGPLLTVPDNVRVPPEAVIVPPPE